MAKTHVDYEKWSGETNQLSASMDNIINLSRLGYTGTDIKPFTDFNHYIDSLNSSLATLRSYTKTDVGHMNKAAENKVQDDKNEAAHTQGRQS